MRKLSFIFTFFAAIFFFQTAVQAQNNAGASAKPVVVPEDINALLTKYTCLACHKPDAKLVGPAYTDVAKRKYTNDQIVALIYEPKPSNWPGYPPMAPMKQVPKADALKIAGWINSLAKPAKATGAKSTGTKSK